MSYGGMDWRNMFVAPPSGNKASFAETVAFNIWAQRQDNIEKLIWELAMSDDPNDEWNQMIAFTHAGFIGAEDLTDAEREYVETEIAKRWEERG